MNKMSLTICTSVAALALAAGPALAQRGGAGPGGSDGAGPTMQTAPSSPGDARPSRMGSDGGASGDMGGAGERPAMRGDGPGDRSEGPGGDDSGATGASEGQAGRDMPARGDRGEREKKADDATRGGEGASDRKDGRADRAGREDRMEQKDRAERDRDKDHDKDRTARDRARDGAGDAASGASEGAEGRDAKHSGSLTRLDGEKRTKVQSSFRSHRSDAVVKDIDIDLNIGVAIPRTVVLHPVPQDVVVIVPEYRAYKYFIYEDRVVVVDPDTWEIVDILVLA